MSLNKGSKSVLAIYTQLILSLFLALAYGFMSPYYLPTAKPIETNVPKLSDKLVLVLMDGMRKDFAFDPKLMPNIYRLSQEGASGVSKTSNFALTIAAIRALGSGVAYSARDVLYNYQRAKTVTKKDSGKVRILNKQGLDSSIDSIFQEAHKQGRKIVLSGDDVWVNCYGSAINEAVLAKSDAETPHGTTDDSEVHAGALKFLSENDFDILIVHYQSLDRTGHNHTPLSNKYRKKALEVDNYISDLEQHLPPNTTLLIFSDHGMSDNGWHGKLDNPPPIVTEPPFIFAKNKIATVQNLSVQQIDLTPTLAILLGLPIPSQSEGVAVTEIFNIDEKQKAEILLANTNARTNYLKQLQIATNQNLALPNLSNSISLAQTKYQEGNFSEAFKLAKEDLTHINQEVEKKIKFNVSPLVKGYLLFSIAAFFLLISTSELNIRWPILSTSLFTLLVSALVASIYFIGLVDPIKMIGTFLSIMLIGIALLDASLLYQFIKNTTLNKLSILQKILMSFLLAFLMLVVAIPNTFTNLSTVLVILITIGFAYRYKQDLFERVLVTYGLVVMAIFDHLVSEPIFLDNKLLKLAIILLVSMFFSGCFKIFNNTYRLVFLTGGVFSGLLVTSQFISKIEAFYVLLFITICLIILYLAVKEVVEKTFIWMLLGLLLLLKVSTFLNSFLVKLFLDLHSIHQIPVFTIVSLIIPLLLPLLCYYIYREVVSKSSNIEFSLLAKNELAIFILPHLTLLLSITARLLIRNPLRNELGKISLLLIFINLIASCTLFLRKEHKIYLFYVSLLTLSALVFEPIHILLVGLVIIFQIWGSNNFSFISNQPILLITLYLAVSFIAYFNSYGNLSLSSFFEEGRYPILGSQITDFSYWNLAIIISFLLSKLVLVESIGLSLLSRLSANINLTIKLVLGVFSLATVTLLGLAWYRYSPGNQQYLANISSTLLFIGIKTVVFTLSLLLTNLFWATSTVKEPEQEISTQEVNLIA